MHETPLVLPIAKLREEHRALVGGKGHSLGELAAGGFAVPPGFVLTTRAAELFLEANGLEAELAKVEAQVANGGLPLDASWPFPGERRAKIAASPLPARVREELHAARRELLGDAPLAVRSSGAKEDLEGTSFAGQYETFLDVGNEA